MGHRLSSFLSLPGRADLVKPFQRLIKCVTSTNLDSFACFFFLLMSSLLGLGPNFCDIMLPLAILTLHAYSLHFLHTDHRSTGTGFRDATGL